MPPRSVGTWSVVIPFARAARLRCSIILKRLIKIYFDFVAAM